MGLLNDPHSVAYRLRIASSSLTHPRDVAIARQYIYELEALAWLRELEEARIEIEKVGAEYKQDDATVDSDRTEITMASGGVRSDGESP